MERRNVLLAAAASLGLMAVPERALAQAWDTAPAPTAWDDLAHARGAELITEAPALMQERLGADLMGLARAGRGGHLSRAWAQLGFFYARTWGTNAEAEAWYTRAVASAEESGDADTLAWVQACVALSYCYERPRDTDTRARAAQALALATRSPLGAVATTKANLALMHVAVAGGDATTAREARAAAQRAAEDVPAVPGGNALGFNPEALLGSLAYADAKQGNADAAEHWARQALQTGDGGRVEAHLHLYEAISAHANGDPHAADAARDVMTRLGSDGQTISLRALAAEAGAAEYAA